MPECGNMASHCEVPIRFDTYMGCSHDCQYCYVHGKYKLNDIKRDQGVKALKAFCEGKRCILTNWCDWDIPLHWGGSSDGFQPIEAEKRYSYECLKYLADRKYPMIISTKGRILATSEYLELLKAGNNLVQVSMLCSEYDKFEKGAPPYEERLVMLRKFVQNSKRVIVRMQPFMYEYKKQILAEVKRMAATGIYAINMEMMRSKKKLSKRMVTFGSIYSYTERDERQITMLLREECHKNGIKFFNSDFSKALSDDDQVCCGTYGLEGFKPNFYTAERMIHFPKTVPPPTEQMKKVGTAYCFKACYQGVGMAALVRSKSFAEIMANIYQKEK